MARRQPAPPVAPGPQRVLGIDTSLRSTGVAVVEQQGSRIVSVEYGALRIPASAPHSRCLAEIHRGLADLIARTAPNAVAIEGIFFSRNVQTAVILGEARGSAIAACAIAGLPVYEYAPRKVKQAVVGFGAADKSQVRKMVMAILGLQEDPQEDAGDALAIAICHLHSHTRHSILTPKEI